MKKTKQFILFAFFIFIIVSCAKTDNSGTGTYTTSTSDIVVVTNTVASITSSSALAGGDIISAGELGITGRGICYGTTPAPTISNSTQASSTTTDTFSVTITGLNLNTTYYVRAYVTTSNGTTYGNEQVFKATFAIGQNYQGGILFYISSTGDSGLIADANDLNDSSIWGCMGTTVTGASNASILADSTNTYNIAHSSCAGDTVAASRCALLILNGYSDWFLPSQIQLQQLYFRKRAVGGFSNKNYWSSSQQDANRASFVSFNDGNSSGLTKNTYAHVRPIRFFHI